MSRNETAENRDARRTIRYPAARERADDHHDGADRQYGAVTEVRPDPGASKMAEYEDRVSPPVGSQALAVRYSAGDRKLMSTM